MATSYDPIERDEPLPRSLPQARRRRSRGLGYFTLFVGAAAGLAMVAVGVFAYKAGERRGAGAVAPVIVAGSGPDKVRPDQPGGMDVPNRDKQIYDRLTPDRGQPPARVERLLPPPEAPMSPPKRVAAAQPDAPGHPPAPPQVPELSPSESFSTPVIPGSNAVVPGSEAAKAATTPAPQAAAKPAAPGAAAMPLKDSTAAASVQPAAGGAYRVQIGALRSEEDAQKTIAQARRNGGELLARFNIEVKRADLGEKGVYYRVQVGPLADASAASSLCDRLKDRKVGCMVVRP
jgi:cell division septation protein DedD